MPKTIQFQYDYRSDGDLVTAVASYTASQSYSWTYTARGRVLTLTDPYTGMAVPQPQYWPAGLHYNAKTYAYDNYGRINSVEMPWGQYYYKFAYDAEGLVKSFDGYGLPGYVAAQTQYTNYDKRGDIWEQYFTTLDGPNTGWAGVSSMPGFEQHDANGFMVPGVTQLAGTSTAVSWDAKTGALLSRGYHKTLPKCGGELTNFGYDNAGRQSSGSDGFCDELGSSENGSFTKTYDAEDHLIGHALNNFDVGDFPACGINRNNAPSGSFATRTISWGPNGHPIQMGGMWLHWDGDTLLYTSKSSGSTIEDIKLGLLGDITPGVNGDQIAVSDRDSNGMYVNQHNNTGFAAWSPSHPYRESCTPGVYPNGPVPPWSNSNSGVVVFGNYAISEPGTDGIYDGYDVIQGVRAYDPQTSGWTTPDAFAGFLHDPISQKPYMWNRNNPTLYSDPSGFYGTGGPMPLPEGDLYNADIGAPVAASNLIAPLMSMITVNNTPNSTPTAQMYTVIPSQLIKSLIKAAKGLFKTPGVDEEIEQQAGAIFKNAAKRGSNAGDYGLGQATEAASNAAGKEFVGPGARLMRNGKGLISRDGLRQYRYPSYKGKLNKWQSNFESRPAPRGEWTSNGHVDIMPQINEL